MTEKTLSEEAKLPLADPSQAEGFDTFPFRPGDRVEVKHADPVWDEEGREFELVVGWQGTVSQVCWNHIWTTHVMVDFPNQGRFCVGWDVLKRIERPDQV